MSLGIKRFFQIFQHSLSKWVFHLSIYCDRSSYFQAVEQSVKKPALGFLSLGQIYEAGSRVVSRDLALAYAMYSLSAARQQYKNPAQDLAMGLKPRLTAKDWMKAREILEKFPHNRA